MIWFLIFLGIVLFLLQRNSGSRILDQVEQDHWTEKNLAEPGEMFSLVISLKNKSRHFLPFLKIKEYLPEDFQVSENVSRVSIDSLGQKVITETTWLRPRQEVRLLLPVSIARRGRYVFRDLDVSGGDFLGLSETSRRKSRFQEVVVAPKEWAEPELAAVVGGFLGEVSVRRFLYEDPVLTLGYREYTGREPMKAISWKQSARGNGLMVKKYDYTLEPSVSVLLNTETVHEKREDLLEVCFSLTRTVCRLLEEKEMKYEFRTNAVSAGWMGDLSLISEGLGEHHFQCVLESLGRATGESISGAAAFLEAAVGASKMVHSRILITPDELPAPCLQRLQVDSGDHLLVLRAVEVMAWQ